MEIKNCEFVTSVANPRDMIVDDRGQIAFVGRSNVGKSSLLNMLCGRRNLARTSSTPGRTRLVNYFLINKDTYFVDLPGYGYARASKEMVVGWQSLIEPYIVNNRNLKCVCVLVDVRHEPTADDKQMILFLNYHRIPYIIIATKCDKLPKTKVKPSLNMLANSLRVGTANIFATSMQGMGKNVVLDKFDQFLNL